MTLQKNLSFGLIMFLSSVTSRSSRSFVLRLSLSGPEVGDLELYHLTLEPAVQWSVTDIQPITGVNHSFHYHGTS